jgi:hypothetical protein
MSITFERVGSYCGIVNAVAPVKYPLRTFVRDLEVNFNSIKVENRPKVLAKLNERIEVRKGKESHFWFVTLWIQRVVNFILFRGFATKSERAEIMAEKFGNFDPAKKEFWSLRMRRSDPAFKEKLSEALSCMPSTKTTFTQIFCPIWTASQSCVPLVESLAEPIDPSRNSQTSLIIWITINRDSKIPPQKIIEYGDADFRNRYTHCFMDKKEYEAVLKNPRHLPKRIYDVINNVH